ncbi:MAG: hypothetical protein AB7P18_14210 [Candidatus Binatia bacterium]
MKEEQSIFDKLYEASEEGVSRTIKDALSHPKVSAFMKNALRNASETKGKIDRSVDTLLTLFNLPSKEDYTKLLAKVETLQGSLVNINMKLDRLLAEQKKEKRGSRKKPSPSSPIVKK